MNSEVAENNYSLTIKWWNISFIIQFDVKLDVSNVDQTLGVLTLYRARFGGVIREQSKYSSDA